VSTHRFAVIHRVTLGVLVIIGCVVGFFTGLQATRTWELGAVHLSIGALAALFANVLFGIAAAWALQSRDAAFLPGIGWFLAVLGLLFLPHPGGDIMLPGAGGDAIAFIVLGFIGAFAAGFAAPRVVTTPAGSSSATTSTPGRPASR
jgi:hypothetical protein